MPKRPLSKLTKLPLSSITLVVLKSYLECCSLHSCGQLGFFLLLQQLVNFKVSTAEASAKRAVVS